MSLDGCTVEARHPLGQSFIIWPSSPQLTQAPCFFLFSLVFVGTVSFFLSVDCLLLGVSLSLSESRGCFLLFEKRELLSLVERECLLLSLV